LHFLSVYKVPWLHLVEGSRCIESPPALPDHLKPAPVFVAQAARWQERGARSTETRSWRLGLEVEWFLTASARVPALGRAPLSVATPFWGSSRSSASEMPQLATRLAAGAACQLRTPQTSAPHPVPGRSQPGPRSRMSPGGAASRRRRSPGQVRPALGFRVLACCSAVVMHCTHCV
jgi:hypothetical protein